MPESFPREAALEVVRNALREDAAHRDATTTPIAGDARASASFVAREPGVLAGIETTPLVFAELDSAVRVDPCLASGERLVAGATIATVEGAAAAILAGERVALNLLQRLSGVATLTRRYVDAVAGTGVAILDTRKTTPGLRALEKWAVRCGGGTNHRPDLAAMAMIKDNHRALLATEGLTLAEGVARIRAANPGIPVEVEIDALDDLEGALAAEPEWILFDNMSPAEMAEAVARTATRAKLEASGGITLDTVRAAAESGVDAISVGALTHSAPALDIALDFELTA